MIKKITTFFAATVIVGCSTVDMNSLKCRNMQVSSKTTLQDVQNTCLISSQRLNSSGLFEVEFRNDSTQKSVTCDFATNSSDAILNSCH
jgi:hypothetical protein